MEFDLKKFVSFGSCFVETGTAYGEGVVRALAAGFTWVKSIEMEPSRVEFNKKKFADNDHVLLFQGDSSQRLGEMLVGEKLPVVIFLDSHPSGDQSAGHKELQQYPDERKLECPYHQHNILRAELRMIFQYAPAKSVILIDDMNGDNADAKEYKKMIDGHYGVGTYEYSFYDADGVKEKVLAALPQ